MDTTVFFNVTAALKDMGHWHGDDLFQGNWADKHWMNTPGPLYCGSTDNCGTGFFEAPNNVRFDAEGFQVIYRQPVDIYELRQVMLASSHDTFQGYGADGDANWSYGAIKVWWSKQRSAIMQEVRRYIEILDPQGTKKDHDYVGGLWRWLDYLASESLRQYLQIYAFFLDTGHPPLAGDTLPELSD